MTGSLTLAADTTVHFFLVLSFSGTAGGRTVQIDQYGGGAASGGFTLSGGLTGDTNFLSSHLGIAEPSTSKVCLLGRVDSAAGVSPAPGETFTALAIQVQTTLAPTLSALKVFVEGAGLTNADISTLGIYISSNETYEGSDTPFLTGIPYDGVSASVGLEFIADGTDYTGSSGAAYYVLFRISVAAGATAGWGIQVRVAVADATDSTGKFSVIAEEPKSASDFPYESSERVMVGLLEVDGDGGKPYTTIQAAIDAIPASAATSSFVVRVSGFDGGDYAGFDIVGKKTTKIIVEGRADDWPVVDAAGNDNGCRISDSSAVTLRKMVFTGAGQEGIELDKDADGATLRNLLIHDNGREEIELDKASDVTIENCTIYDDDGSGGGLPRAGQRSRQRTGQHRRCGGCSVRAAG